jgi:hypothetical protein
MHAPYIPGQPNQYFPIHKYHDVPIGRNIRPIEEYHTHHYVGATAELAKGIAVHLLTAEHLWATFQTEAEELLKEHGRWIEDDRQRNRRINAAYAKLWLADKRFQWAGLAAFASKQVGCGLLHSGDLLLKSRRERENIQRSFAAAGVSGVEYATIMQMGTEVGAHKIAKRLGFGNKHLFLDIYPLHRFYMERGWEEFSVNLDKRKNTSYAVHWEIDREVLPFGVPFSEIWKGFREIENQNLYEGVKLLALHEQANILQTIMYRDKLMQALLAMNQFAWATGFPTGDTLRYSLRCQHNAEQKQACRRGSIEAATQSYGMSWSACSSYSKLLNNSINSHAVRRGLTSKLPSAGSQAAEAWHESLESAYCRADVPCRCRSLVALLYADTDCTLAPDNRYL